MSQLIPILQYYARNEADEEEKESESLTYSCSYPFSFWNPFPSVVHEHHHHHYAADVPRQNQDQKSEPKRDTVAGMICSLLTAGVGYFAAGALVKYRRVSADLLACDEINQQNPSTLGRKVEKLIECYQDNRLWSLANQCTIFASCGGLTLGFLLPSPALGAVSVFLLATAIVSGGIRCGTWRYTQIQCVRTAKNIIEELNTQQDRPPRYNPI